MHGVKTSLIVLLSISVFAAFAFLYPKSRDKELINTNQDPQYLIEARKNIIGVWYDVESPLDVVEFTQDGTIIYRNHDLPEGRATYKIVNTTPICGKDVYVNESEKTMFLVETDDDEFESCYYFWIGMDDDNKPALTTSGVGANGNSHMSYRKK